MKVLNFVNLVNGANLVASVKCVTLATIGAFGVSAVSAADWYAKDNLQPGHDPSMTRFEDGYALMSTNNNLQLWTSEDAYTWESEGVDGYTIKKCKKEDVGTEIILHIKEDTEEFEYSKYLDEYELKNLIKKYSDYISFPIKMEVTHHELVDEEKKKYEDHKEIETINSMIPLWKKNKSEVSDEDYENFYIYGKRIRVK